MLLGRQMGKLMRSVVQERNRAVIEGRIDMLRKLIRGFVSSLRRDFHSK